MGKLKHLGMSLLLATTFFSCGDDYDDTALRNDVNDLKSRVEKLESWCSTTNTQISALQGLVSALEQNDYVTGVTPIVEGSVEVGYTITFTKSKPITIYHGKDGKNGADGINGVDGITPQTIKKAVRDLISISKAVAKEEVTFEKDPESMSRKELEKLIADVQKKMQKAAADLNFEAAAELRDKMIELKTMLQNMD